MIEFLERRAASGKRVKALEDRPKLNEELSFVWSLFCKASAGRPTTGFGVSGLPVSEIIAILELYGVRGEMKRWYFELISGLDNKYVNLMTKELETKRKASTSGR